MKQKQVHGLVRRLDDLGRVVVPKGYRELFSMHPGTLVEITADAHGVYVKKHVPKTSALVSLELFQQAIAPAMEKLSKENQTMVASTFSLLEKVCTQMLDDEMLAEQEPEEFDDDDEV